LAYLVKRKDPDGIEVHFTSNPSNKCRNKDRKPLLAHLNTIIPSGQWNIGCTLGQILSDYDWTFPPERKGLLTWRGKTRKKMKKWGVNIYVFTDGVWEEGDGWLADIVESINKLLDGGVEPRRIGIQFIQFGNDQEGTQRLKLLDDGLREHGVLKLVKSSRV
jgi:hypothetical protein